MFNERHRRLDTPRRLGFVTFQSNTAQALESSPADAGPGGQRPKIIVVAYQHSLIHFTDSSDHGGQENLALTVAGAKRPRGLPHLAHALQNPVRNDPRKT